MRPGSRPRRVRKGGVATLHVTKEPTRPIEQECWESLACAIVERAAEDYALALRGRVKYERSAQGNKETMERFANRMRMDCKKFFRSGWCMMLVSVDGNKIMQEIENQCDAQAL